jgi:ABC-type sugar transport system ATPase subunit
VSSYNPELLGVADRIVVFFDRRIVATYARGDITERELLRATMFGAAEPVRRS